MLMGGTTLYLVLLHVKYAQLAMLAITQTENQLPVFLDITVIQDLFPVLSVQKFWIVQILSNPLHHI